MRGISPDQLVLDHNGFPMVLAKPQRVEMAEAQPEALEVAPVLAAPSAAPEVSVSDRPIGGSVLSLIEVATALGLSPDEAVELLQKLSIPRVVGWPKRDIEELRERIRSGTIKIDRSKQ